MGGRDHSCEVCGHGGFNDPDGDCECDPACNDPDCSYRSEIETGYYVPASDLAKAQAERDEARLEAARWQGSFDGMVAVERELKTDLAKAEAALVCGPFGKTWREACEEAEAERDEARMVIERLYVMQLNGRLCAIDNACSLCKRMWEQADSILAEIEESE